MNPIPTTSCAAVFQAVGKPLTLEQFPLPDLKGSEAFARIRCATICGSDLHYWLEGGIGTIRVREPIILGHEAAGAEAVRGLGGEFDAAFGTGFGEGGRIAHAGYWRVSGEW